MQDRIRFNEPLAPRTTLGVGGPATAFLEVEGGELEEALALARERGWPVQVLGGGSNLVVADAGVKGLVLSILDQNIHVSEVSGCTHTRVGAGQEWDAFVSWAVSEGLAGVECLSGIPGRVGAAPMQNIGAYGQEVAETIVSVHVWDRQVGGPADLPAEDCGFAYRDSRFKSSWQGRYVVLAVTFALRRGGPPTLRYRDLQSLGADATLAAVRAHVLRVRASKAMVFDPAEPDSRSAGSFFTNPLVSAEDLPAIESAAARLRPDPLPRWPAGDRIKLPAAWLIEAAGVQKGEGFGGAAISRKHSLAIVNRVGATAADVVGLAASVRARVQEALGVTLHPEPRLLGFEIGWDELLRQHL